MYGIMKPMATINERNAIEKKTTEVAWDINKERKISLIEFKIELLSLASDNEEELTAVENRKNYYNDQIEKTEKALLQLFNNSQAIVDFIRNVKNENQMDHLKKMIQQLTTT